MKGMARRFLRTSVVQSKWLQVQAIYFVTFHPPSSALDDLAQINTGTHSSKEQACIEARPGLFFLLINRFNYGVLENVITMPVNALMRFLLPIIPDHFESMTGSSAWTYWALREARAKPEEYSSSDSLVNLLPLRSENTAITAQTHIEPCRTARYPFKSSMHVRFLSHSHAIIIIVQWAVHGLAHSLKAGAEPDSSIKRQIRHQLANYFNVNGIWSSRF